MLTISRSVRLSKSPDGGVLLDVDRGTVFSLNSVGTRIVELLQQGNDATNLAEAISREFHVSEEIARNDVIGFLTSLREQQLLNDSDASCRS
jgi:hypothetical protein